MTYDIRKVAELVGIDMDSMRMLVGMLAETLENSVNEIGNDIAAMDYKAIHDHGHKLKGSAANLGFERLAECCRIIEQSAKVGADIDYNSAFNDIKSESMNIIAWYKSGKS